MRTDNLVNPDEGQSLNDSKFFNSFSYAWMQYGGNLCILWPLRLHWNCNFDHWKFSTMGLLFILLPTKNTICIYYYYSYTRVSQSRVLTHVGTILKYFSSLDETFCEPIGKWMRGSLQKSYQRATSRPTSTQNDHIYFRIICTCISLMKAFALPKYRHLRGILFLVFGLCGIAPCIHSTFFHGVEYSFSKEMFRIQPTVD